MIEYTRRESILSFLAAPFAGLFGKREEESQEAVLDIIQTANGWKSWGEDGWAVAEDWREQASGFAADADYWRERCLAAEKDLHQREVVAARCALLMDREVDNKFYADYLRINTKPYTHPDCLSDRGQS